MKWGKATPFGLSFTAKGTYGDVPVAVEGYMEFDGFIWTKLTIPRWREQSLDGLALEIRCVPTSPRCSTLRSRPGHRNQERQGVCLELRADRESVAWLGNDESPAVGDRRRLRLGERGSDQRHPSHPREQECLFRVTMVDHTFRWTPAGVPAGLARNAGEAADQRHPRLRSGDQPAHLAGRHRQYRNFRPRPSGSSGSRPGTAQNTVTAWVPGLPGDRPWAWQEVDNYYAAVGGRSSTRDVEQLLARQSGNAAFSNGVESEEPGSVALRDCRCFLFGSAWRTVGGGQIFRDLGGVALHKSLTDYPWIAPRVQGFYMDVVQGFWVRRAAPRTAREFPRTRHEWMGTRELKKRVYVMLRQRVAASAAAQPPVVRNTHMPELAFADLYLTGENLGWGKRLGTNTSWIRVLPSGTDVPQMGHSRGVPPGDGHIECHDDREAVRTEGHSAHGTSGWPASCPTTSCPIPRWSTRRHLRA